MGFFNHFLPLHDLGKFDHGNPNNEERSEAILKIVFEEQNLGFSDVEQDFFLLLVGFHGKMDKLPIDGAIRNEWRQRLRELNQKYPQLSEQTLLKFFQGAILHRVAEKVQSEHFGFVNEETFKNFLATYHTGRELIDEVFTHKSSSPKGVGSNTKNPQAARWVAWFETPLALAFGTIAWGESIVLLQRFFFEGMQSWSGAGILLIASALVLGAVSAIAFRLPHAFFNPDEYDSQAVRKITWQTFIGGVVLGWPIVMGVWTWAPILFVFMAVAWPSTLHFRNNWKATREQILSPVDEVAPHSVVPLQRLISEMT